MRWTQTLIPTRREAPADAQSVSQQLLVRAGMIHALAPGRFGFLPLGLRSLQKIAAIVRREMSAVGGSEVLVDASTAEQSLAGLMASHPRSLKHLPLTLYQIALSGQDDALPRTGLLRARESLTLNASGFHADAASLESDQARMRSACERIFTACDVSPLIAEAGLGEQQFLVPHETGNIALAISDRGNYAATLAWAATGERPWTFSEAPAESLQKVHTPGLSSVAEVCRFLGIEPRQILKTMVFRATSAHGTRWVVAVVRGDHEVSEAKLARSAAETMGVSAIHLVDDAEVRALWAIGFVGPDAAMKHGDAVLIVDPDAAQGNFWAAGANETDFHVTGFNWFRECGDRLADPAKTTIADIRIALPGDLSPRNDSGRLNLSHGAQLGSLQRLDTSYSEAADAVWLNSAGHHKPMLMVGCRLNLDQLLAAAIEQSHDDRGIVWPNALAPYSAIVTPIQYEGDVKMAADALHDQLNEAGIDTLLDDRDVRPGVKFADADLIGVPFRINIGERNLREGKVELKRRTAREPEHLSIKDVLRQLC